MIESAFISLVRELRKAQKDYERSKRYDDHARVEELCREVDEYLEYLEPKKSQHNEKRREDQLPRCGRRKALRDH